MRTLTAILPGLLLALPAAGGAAPAAPGEEISVVVTLKDRADLRRFHPLARRDRRREVVRALRSRADATQPALRAFLERRRAEGRVSRVTPLWVSNAISVTAAPEVIRELAARADVAEVSPDDVDVVPSALPAGPPEPNLGAVRAPDLWGLGLLGQGVVVATMDSGADLGHPDLAGRWRGGSNSWYDPYGQHPTTPADLSGHGTWTLGVLVGGDAGGTTTGVAPGASWIAARIFDDQGRATATAIHLAFQWLLDPDGDPATDDAPDVVNGSWSYGYPGCTLAFQPDVQALAAAAIVPVFSAGNFGPGSGTSVSPANYPESISVGAVDGTLLVAAESGRGPSACGGGTYPTVVAPGVAIRTADLLGGWTAVSGTSIAAPHVSGLVALLRGAYPAATPSQLQAALAQSAVDLGPPGPDADYGNGLADGVGAHGLLATAPPPPPPAPPVAADDAYALAQDTSASFTAPGLLANDSSPSGLPLTAVLVSGPGNGTLSLQPSGAFSYTPNPGWYGQDGFGYQASDGLAVSAVAAVTLTVTHVNSPPVAVNDAASTTRNVAVTTAPVANDHDPDGTVVPGTLALVSAPRYGTATNLGNGTVRYAPRRCFRGTDSFTYTVKDDAGARSNVATVTVTVR